MEMVEFSESCSACRFDGGDMKKEALSFFVLLIMKTLVM